MNRHKISRRKFISVTSGLIGLLMTPHLSVAEESKNDLGTWERKADMPISRARHHSGVEAVGGKLYVIGGESGFNRPTGYYVDMYDPKTDTWTKLNPKPLTFSSNYRGFDTAVINDIIYVFGGFGAGNTPKKLESYNPKTDTWTELKSPFNNYYHREGFAVSALNNKLYILGGFSFLGDIKSYLDVYDPKTDESTRSKDMTSDRCGLKAVTIEGKLYVIGGFSKYYDSGTLMEVYDPKTDKWTRLPDMPTERGDFDIGVINEKLYVIGGERDRKFITNVDVYDTRKGKWSRALDLQNPRRGVGIGVIEGKLYAVGGTITPQGVAPDCGELPILQVFTPPK